MTTDNTTLEGTGLGRIAYQAHEQARGGEATGVSWAELVESKPREAAGYCAAARAVIDATIARS